ncbi:MAG: tRNA (guanosine(37)-N1)-methyltransferase TrmD [Chloroflexi bacterium]|nr:tRNA (guanosine(37)-N1)-methyltransferase TrmD [Chloroflexota bacterium]
MKIDILTLFPKMFDGPFSHSIIKRAVQRDLLSIDIHNIRDFGLGKHKIVDDYPYGGGSGMVMMPEPIFECLSSLKIEKRDIPVILLTPQGRVFNQQIANELATMEQIVLICGHYEGVDERVRVHMVTDEISIGDYVLSGGEPAAIVVVDSITRRIPGALGSEVTEDSHLNNLLEYPQYTRPPVYRRWKVPPVLLSGNHAEINKWQRHQSIIRTLKRRPDLLSKAKLTLEEIKFIDHIKD